MRILATSAPNQGHFYPMVPLLWALRGAGHDVRVAVAGDFATTAATTGLPVMQLGGELNIGQLGGSGPAQQGADIQSLVDHVIGYYIPLAVRSVAPTVKLVDSWLPDLVIHTGWEFAGPIAAARRGIPTILHGWGMAQPPQLDAPVTEALTGLHRDWDLPERLPAPLKRVDVCPPTLQVGRTGADVLPMACVPYSGSAVVPGWLTEPRSGRRVCVTLGNAPIKGDHDNVMRTVLKGLSQVDAQILVATGDHLADLDGLPSNMRAVRGLPLSVLLSDCDLVIHHGGAGSALATLAHGLPALALPQMCVQYQHADRIAEVGAGLRLHPEQAEAEAIEAAVTGLLSEASSARETAAAIQTEMRSRPRAADVVTFIEAAMGV